MIPLTFWRRRLALEPLMGRVQLDPVAGRLRVDELTIGTSREDTRINALLLNIGELSHAIQQLQIATISYINFAGLISVGALTVGLIKPERLIEIFSPYALTVVLAFLVQLYTDIERLTTLREIMERRVNDTLDTPAFLGINELSSRHRGRFSVRLVAPLLALPILLFAFHSWQTTRHPAQHWWIFNLHIVNTIGLAFCALLLVSGAAEMLFARPRAIREAAATLGDPGVEVPPRLIEKMSRILRPVRSLLDRRT
jgi:hypothetical protein